MYLKSLTLHGFKSFPDRTLLDFNTGITSIVGPNGCGKSNIVDSLKWIFGGQSVKELRGQSMKDVIFAGTDNRRPLSMAEVVVVFDNSKGLIPTDLSEVSITRRLYRSGESEYLINEQRCRLRDIKDLFMDTGIGTESYSILEQGKLDALIQSTPKDRRIIFEEAAGISRFRSRRDESLRQLKRTEENLYRLGDIVSEIESRIRSVRIQAGRARKYREMEQELRTSRLFLAWNDLVKLYRERLEWTFRHFLITNKITRLNDSLTESKAEFKALLETYHAAEEENRTFASRLQQCTAQQHNLAENIEITGKRIEELTSTHSKWITEAEEAQRQLSRYEEEGATLENEQKKTAEEGTQLHELDQKLQQDRADAAETLKSAQEELSSVKSSLIDALHSITALRNRITQIEGECNLSDSRIDRLENEANRIEKTKAVVAAEIANARSRFTAVSAEYHATEEKKNALQEEIGKEEQKLHEKDRRWADTKTKLHTLASRRELLQRLLSELEGVGQAARKVIHAARENRLSNVRGLLAELITTDAHYARAVESALGPWSQAIVVQSEDDIQEIRTFLGPEASFSAIVLDTIAAFYNRFSGPGAPEEEENGNGDENADATEADSGGNAPFADSASRFSSQSTAPPLSPVQSPPPPGAPRRSPEAETICLARSQHQRISYQLPFSPYKCKHAAELIEYPAELKEALFSILNNTLVIEEEAWETLNEHPPCPWRFVNKKGGIFEPWGGVRWGTPTGVLVRRTELTHCIEEIAWLESVEENLSSEVSNKKNLLVKLKQTREEYTRKQTNLHGRIQALDELIKQVTNRHADLLLQQDVSRKERQSLAAERRTLEAGKDELTASVHKQEKTRVSLEQNVTFLEEQVQTCANRRQENESRLSELRANMAAHKEKQHHLTEACARIQRLIEEKTRYIEETEKEKNAVSSRREDATAELNRIKENLEKQQEEEKELTGCLGESTEQVQQLKMQKEEQEKDLEDLESTIDERRRELSEIQLEERELIVKAQTIIQNIQEQYGINLKVELCSRRHNEVFDSIEEPVDMEELRKRVKELKQKLDRHGNVNLEAIDELKALEERFDYLASQRDDLVQARTRLGNVIKDLNRKSRRLFAETFERVNSAFSELFRKAFNGGRAELELEEGEDVLNAGISITARPPGKKTSSVKLLSGGERTLVTLVLLFAVLRVKPAPFCVLDEVDAPLDEANIRRFLVLVGEFITNTQFLIITHNKLTMTSSNELIGITMEEKGVSKTISIDLKEAVQYSE